MLLWLGCCANGEQENGEERGPLPLTGSISWKSASADRLWRKDRLTQARRWNFQMNQAQERVGNRLKIELREFYKDYTPPRQVFKTIRKILDRVPQQYLHGLDCVVLTNMSGQPRRSRLGKIPSSKGYVSRSRVLGLYHGAHRGKLPWIEIYVDKIAGRHRGHLWIPFLMESVFGDVLLHEIGHHIHATTAPEHSDKEDVAERWRKKLWGAQKRNWLLRYSAKYLLVPILKLVLLFLRAWKRAATAHRAKAQS